MSPSQNPHRDKDHQVADWDHKLPKRICKFLLMLGLHLTDMRAGILWELISKGE
jgi:hypothetical protein